MMHSTYFLLASFQLAVTVLLAVVPFISATSNLAHAPRRGIHFRDPAIQERQRVDMPDGWKEIGCYTDDPTQRTLTSNGFSDSFGMKVETCVNFCDRQKKNYAGLENGTDCYCGDVLTLGATLNWDPPNNCTIKCAGDEREFCGDKNRLNVYSSWTDETPPPQPTFVQTARFWTYRGCFSDSNDARTLTVEGSVFGGPDANSVENCISACEVAGNYKWAGMEFAQQCWCDNSTQNGGQMIASGHCLLACPGDSSQICGGASSLVMYHNDF